ncbi:MAG: 2-hydroxyhepta-2,4-diene-1,7-dioate isomerase, partial [Ginsengibacter sp.]
MKLYKTKSGIVIEKEGAFYLIVGQDWDRYINDDNLYSKMEKATKNETQNPEAKNFIESQIEAPIQSQEIW